MFECWLHYGDTEGTENSHGEQQMNCCLLRATSVPSVVLTQDEDFESLPQVEYRAHVQRKR